MEEIKDLVHQHPDKFTVSDLWLVDYLCVIIGVGIWLMKFETGEQLETVKTGNKGYNAEITVVTYCRTKKDIDDMTKFRILLVSSL